MKVISQVLAFKLLTISWKKLSPPWINRKKKTRLKKTFHKSARGRLVRFLILQNLPRMAPVMSCTLQVLRHHLKLLEVPQGFQFPENHSFNPPATRLPLNLLKRLFEQPGPLWLELPPVQSRIWLLLPRQYGRQSTLQRVLPEILFTLRNHLNRPLNLRLHLRVDILLRALQKTRYIHLERLSQRHHQSVRRLLS